MKDKVDAAVEVMGVAGAVKEHRGFVHRRRRKTAEKNSSMKNPLQKTPTCTTHTMTRI
jgi:hypothetical protein